MLLKERLAGKALLLTGASGFVGKAILAQIVRGLPDTSVTVLLRGDAHERLHNEVLTSDPFEGLDGSAVLAVSGDLGDEGMEGVADGAAGSEDDGDAWHGSYVGRWSDVTSRPAPRRP